MAGFLASAPRIEPSLRAAGKVVRDSSQQGISAA